MILWKRHKSGDTRVTILFVRCHQPLYCTAVTGNTVINDPPTAAAAAAAAADDDN